MKQVWMLWAVVLMLTGTSFSYALESSCTFDSETVHLFGQARAHHALRDRSAVLEMGSTGAR